MKDTRRRMEVFSFFDYTGIARHLTKMAGKGWLLEKISNFGWTYRRIAPKKLTFYVCHYPKASDFDPEPTEEQKEFHDFCEHTGWVLAATSAQMQIFYNEQENPIPIDTDPMLEIETIHAAAKKFYLPQLLCFSPDVHSERSVICFKVFRGLYRSAFKRRKPVLRPGLAHAVSAVYY